MIVNNFDKDIVPELFKTHPLIELIYSDLDIKSHNKYYHTALKYPNDVIITIDDDVEYPETFIEDCVKSYTENPNVVHAGRVHKIKYRDGNMLPYKQWEWESKEEEASFDLFFTGVGGVVYPPNFFKESDLPITIINQYIKTDDILLNYIARKNRCKIKRIPVRNNYKDIHVLLNKYNLCTFNVMFNNDKCLKDIQFNQVNQEAKDLHFN